MSWKMWYRGTHLTAFQYCLTSNECEWKERIQEYEATLKRLRYTQKVFPQKGTQSLVAMDRLRKYKSSIWPDYTIFFWSGLTELNPQQAQFYTRRQHWPDRFACLMKVLQDTLHICVDLAVWTVHGKRRPATQDKQNRSVWGVQRQKHWDALAEAQSVCPTGILNMNDMN